jgi:hypothetical protein
MGQLHHVVALEQQIRARTRDLAETLDRLRIANARLSQAERDAVRARNSLPTRWRPWAKGFAMFDASDHPDHVEFALLRRSAGCAQPDRAGAALSRLCAHRLGKPGAEPARCHGARRNGCASGWTATAGGM